MGRRRGADVPWWRSVRVLVAGVGILSLVAAGALTAANSVPATRVDDQTITDLPPTTSLPAECVGMTFDVTGSGSGVIVGSAGKDWIIGSDQVDTISGLAGADCIEGKGADDVIDGGLGNDVCLGGGGTDVFLGCETQVQ